MISFYVLYRFYLNSTISSLLPVIYSRIEKRNENYSISEQDINTIRDKIAANIESFIKDQLEAFVKHERRVSFLLFWYDYDHSSCKSYISCLIKNPAYFFQIYRVFIRSSRATTNGIASESIFVDKNLIANFIDLGEFEQLLIMNSASSMNNSELEMKDLFYTPLED